MPWSDERKREHSLRIKEYQLDVPWVATRCPCPSEDCHSGQIDPDIVSGQGVMEYLVAEHVVELHNRSLND